MRPLTEDTAQLLPSDADVHRYRDRGWYLSPRLFTDDEIDLLSRTVEDFYAGHRDRTLPVPLNPSSYWAPEHGDVQRHNDYICYESTAIADIVCKPLMGAVAARLMNTPTARLWSSTLIHKPARADEPSNIVPWHIDLHHWQTCTSDNLITAFIPLHDCDEESGTITVLDGSHRWEELPPAEHDDPNLHFAERPGEALEEAMRATARHNGAAPEPVPVVIPRGGVSFHHCRTFHASGPNLKPHPRRVITVRFQDEANAWRHLVKPNGETASYSHDQLVRRTEQGTPDYADPEFCPVVWSEPGASR